VFILPKVSGTGEKGQRLVDGVGGIKNCNTASVEYTIIYIYAQRETNSEDTTHPGRILYKMHGDG
jgi:hypothetical protein